MKIRVSVQCVILSIIVWGCIFSDNTLYKVYYHHVPHKGTPHQASSAIELCSVVFYFDQKPIINALPDHTQEKRDASSTKLTFFLPKTHVQNEQCRHMIHHLYKECPSIYRVQITEENTPIAGLKIVITYDPSLVSFVYDQFEAIGLQKGLVFRFYNKQLLHKLNKQNALLLRMAQLKKKDQPWSSTADMAGMMKVRTVILI